MPSSTTYSRNTWNEIQANFVQPYSLGVKGEADIGTTNFDLTLADDVFIRALEVVVSGATMGDTMSIQIIDVEGVMGVAPGTVVLCPVNQWNVLAGSNIMSYTGVVPKKALATMKIRVVYTSVAEEGSVEVGVNFNLLKVLS